MTRSRRRGPSPWRTLAACGVVLAAVVGVAVGATGTGAFTTGAVDRGSAVPVADDANGVLGLDVASSVHANATDRLVTLTDRVGHATTVTVTLRAAARPNATLVADGTAVGDSATFPLAAGTSRTVDVAVAANVAAGTPVGFDVTADGGGLRVSAPDRTTTVTT